jgi:hypothetical protein
VVDSTEIEPGTQQIVRDWFGATSEPILEFLRRKDFSRGQRLLLAQAIRRAKHTHQPLTAGQVVAALQRSGTSPEHLKLESFERLIRSAPLELRMA